MLSNYFTLQHLALDLHRTLAGLRLVEAFSQNPYELVLQFAGNDQRWLMVGCEPSRNHLHLRPNIDRARRNSISFFANLAGQTLAEVCIHPRDRIVGLRFDSRHSLVLLLYASRANVLHVDPEGVAVGAFLRPKEETGKQFDEFSALAISRWNTRQDFLVSQDELKRELSAIGHISLFGALKKVLPTFGSVLVREVLHRAGLSEDTTVAQVVPNLGPLVAGINGILQEMRVSPQPRIYYEQKTPLLFSILPLHHLQGKEFRSFDSLHEGIRVFLASAQKQKYFDERKRALIRTLRQKVEHAERSIQKLRDELDLAQQAIQYDLFGKLLMLHLHEIPEHAREFTTENLFSPNREQVTIPLQAQRTPAQNAERYFEKAKRAKRAQQEASERLARLNNEWEKLNDLLVAIEAIHSEESFRQLLETKKKELEVVGIHTRKEATSPQESVPFRVFYVEGGFQVWVGKSSENNDMLTLHYARPNDIWFHARGASGSHVVLRMGTGKGEPSKKALEQAAAIAAFYSKMKKAKNVPVAMTLRKYVRKPKGAPAGTVTIEREKILFVDPALPTEGGGKT